MAKTGRQTPTHEYKISYRRTLGKDAVTAYEKTGRKAMSWQKKLLNVILAVNADKLWTHTKYGYSVPRRNGKNEVVVAREIYGLEQGERICHTAHRTTTSHTAFDRLYRLLLEAGYQEAGRKKKTMPKNSFFASKQYGLESIELTGGGTIVFRTRTNNGGLGEGFDLLIIDEAQEYTEKQESALIYTVSDSKNPQTIFCGTPPTATSSGTVFPKMRETVLAGKGVDAGWAEWSIDSQTDDATDTELWYETNPSLGTILTERNIRAEISGDVIDFNIQRLGLWIAYSQKSVISAAEWDILKAKTTPKLDSRRFFGVKYGKDGTNAAVAVASKTQTGKIFVEAIDCTTQRAGNAWMMPYFRNPNMKQIAVDGEGKRNILEAEMKAAGIKKPVFPTVKEIIIANAMFEQAVFEGSVVHAGQESLRNVVSNCDHRAIGSGGGFGFKSLVETYDIEEGQIVTVPSTGTYEVNTFAVNIRPSAGTAGESIGQLRKNSAVLIDEIKDGWGHFAGGWIKLSYAHKI